MNKTVTLDIPDTETRVRRKAIRDILNWLTTHEINTDQAVSAFEDLIRYEIKIHSARISGGDKDLECSIDGTSEQPEVTKPPFLNNFERSIEEFNDMITSLRK